MDERIFESIKEEVSDGIVRRYSDDEIAKKFKLADLELQIQDLRTLNLFGLVNIDPTAMRQSNDDGEYIEYGDVKFYPDIFVISYVIDNSNVEIRGGVLSRNISDNPFYKLDVVEFQQDGSGCKSVFSGTPNKSLNFWEAVELNEKLSGSSLITSVPKYLLRRFF